MRRWLVLIWVVVLWVSLPPAARAASPVESFAVRVEFAPLIVKDRSWGCCAGGKLQGAGILVGVLDFRLPIELEGAVGYEWQDGTILGLQARWRMPWLDGTRHRLTLGGGVWILTGNLSPATTAVARADVGYEVRVWRALVLFGALGPEIGLRNTYGEGDDGEHAYKKSELEFRARFGVGGRFAVGGG